MRRVHICLLAVIGLAVAASAQTPPATIALIGARIIDGTGAAPISNATLLVTNGRVDRVGSSASLKVPQGATRIDVAGKTIIPGLINAHGHLGNGDRSLPLYDQIIQQLRIYSRFGVTTVYTLGDDGKESVRIRDENERGPLTRSRLYAAGPSAVAEDRGRGAPGHRRQARARGVLHQDPHERQRERHAARRVRAR